MFLGGIQSEGMLANLSAAPFPPDKWFRAHKSSENTTAFSGDSTSADCIRLCTLSGHFCICNELDFLSLSEVRVHV